jgi:dCMP deaminase
MRQVPSWIDYFMGIAQAVSVRSKDPNTQVGSVLTDAEHRIIAVGYNGFPQGVRETSPRWTPEQKDNYVIHSEDNCLLNAARAGVSTKGSTLYCTLAPCPACARKVIASGVGTVYFPRSSIMARLEARPELVESHNFSMNLFMESRVRCIQT